MTNLRTFFSTLVLVLSGLVACGDDAAPPGGTADASTPRRPGRMNSWESTLVDDGDVGLHLRLAVDRAGDAHLAYMSTSGRSDGECTELGGSDLPTRTVWSLVYATSSGSGFRSETVDELLLLGEPPGLDLRVDQSGTPAIAALTGEPLVMQRYCGASDVGLFRPDGSGWSVETLVEESGEAATGMPASDFGYVVGYWPALAFGPGGQTAIAYQDVHAGSIQSDDLRRADLEVVLSDGAGWRAVPIDAGRGAGWFSRATYDQQGRLVVVYFNSVESGGTASRGLWVARGDGDSWEQVRLSAGGTVQGPDILALEDGTIHIAQYDAGRGIGVLFTSPDDSMFGDSAAWSEETFGDGRYDEGYDPSLAVDPSGRLAVAYYRCALATAGLGECDPDDDAVVFAYRDGSSWEVEVVDDGFDGAGCGRFPALAFGPGGEASLAYQCQANVGGTLSSRVYLARRPAL